MCDTFSKYMIVTILCCTLLRSFLGMEKIYKIITKKQKTHHTRYHYEALCLAALTSRVSQSWGDRRHGKVPRHCGQAYTQIGHFVDCIIALAEHLPRGTG